MSAKTFFIFLLCLPVCTVEALGMVVTSGNTIVIDQPVSEDLYLAGGTIVINAPVHGDLVVAGGKVYINDSIYRDVLIAGGTVVIKGHIGGKLRCLGGTVSVDETIQGDLVVGGGNISVEKRGIVAGSVLAGGGDLTIFGEVKEDVRASVRKFLLYGPVGRDLDCRAETMEIHGKVGGASKLAASGNLDIGYSAVFGGVVRYWAPGTPDFGRSVQSGQATMDQSLAFGTRHWYLLGGGGLLTLLWYFSMALVLIILFQYLFRPLFQQAGEKVYDQTWKSLGAGLAFFIGAPVLTVILFISLVGMPIGFVLLSGYIFVVMTCTSITSLVAAHWFSGLMGSNGKFWEQVGIAVVLYVLLRLILSIPLFGWILYPLLVCIACGALILSVRWKKRAMEGV